MRIKDPNIRVDKLIVINTFMNDMRHYINLIETLSEAPIDDFKRAADKDLGISQGQMDNDDAKLFGAFIGGAIGIASPFFMDIDFILKVLGATFGAAVGSGLGIGLATKPIDFEQVSIEKRKYADEVWNVLEL